jgi:hypothetical protein
MTVKAEGEQTMTNHEKDQNQQPERKKVSLQDAIKQKLAQKKQDANNNSGFSKAGNQPHMKSQTNKKVNTQRRRTGGS